MPEGDTIFRTARQLHRALAGRTVTRFAAVSPRLTRIDEDRPVAGRTVEGVRSAGKHLLVAFSGGLLLRTHQRMSGSWHLYRPGERWRRSPAAARIVIETPEFVAVAFHVHDAEFLEGGARRRGGSLGRLGPDLLAAQFDEREAVARLREPPDEAVASALLAQWRLAGIGNVFKSETLFLCGVHPSVRVADLNDERLHGLVATARRLLLANVAEAPPGLAPRRVWPRQTTGRASPGERLWVYGRRGQPCRRCGTPIAYARTGTEARGTYWCPRCQPAPP
jgi:endonuclease-8